jgi:hypothetical protein
MCTIRYVLRASLSSISHNHFRSLIAAVRSKSDDTEVAFREVVSLDRLRSRHAKSTRKTAGKRTRIEQVHDAIHRLLI